MITLRAIRVGTIRKTVVSTDTIVAVLSQSAEKLLLEPESAIASDESIHAPGIPPSG
jgi:hypothetical protein